MTSHAIMFGNYNKNNQFRAIFSLPPGNRKLLYFIWLKKGRTSADVTSYRQQHHEQQLTRRCSCAAVLRAPERILCENPLLTRPTHNPLHGVLLWNGAGCIWKPPGDDFHSPLQAAAFSNQLLDHLSGLCRLHGGSDCDALQHSEVRGELLVLWGKLLSISHLFWWVILLCVHLPLVLYLSGQVHCDFWPPGLSSQGHCVCFWHVYCLLLALFNYLFLFPSWPRSKRSWPGGSSKCSHLCGRLSDCSESDLGIGGFSIIFHPHPCDGSSLLQCFPHC